MIIKWTHVKFEINRKKGSNEIVFFLNFNQKKKIRIVTNNIYYILDVTCDL